jgi:hypothetical protein
MLVYLQGLGHWQSWETQIEPGRLRTWALTASMSIALAPW